MRRHRKGMGILLLLMVAVLSLSTLSSKAGTLQTADKPVYQLRFGIIYHANQGHRAPYLAAARRFAQLVEERTAHHVHVHVFDAGYGSRNLSNKVDNNRATLKDVADGKLEMCDIQGDIVGAEFDKQFFVFDMPYLFRDYEHARKVVEGPIGQQMLDGLRSHHLRGLAFTYSGGFRVIASKKPIRKMEDLSGVRTSCMRCPILNANLSAWGADPVASKRGETFNQVEEGQVDATEATYNFYSSDRLEKELPVLNELSHNFFVTVMVANNDFLQKLPPTYRKIILDSAKEAAMYERHRTIVDNDAIRRQVEARGVKVYTLSKSEQARLARVAEPVYKKYSGMVGANLIREIRNLQ